MGDRFDDPEFHCLLRQQPHAPTISTFRRLGAWEHASAIRWASARPSKDLLYSRSGMERSREASNPCRKKRSRTRASVAVLVSNVWATCRSRGAGPSPECSPRSVFSKIRARLSILAGALPEEMSLRKCSRSALVSLTRYFLLMWASLGTRSPQDKSVRPKTQNSLDRGLATYCWVESISASDTNSLASCVSACTIFGQGFSTNRQLYCG